MGKYSSPGRDVLIGMLVVFENKVEDSGVHVESGENCNEMQLNPSDTMVTKDSTLLSAHPTYQRHKKLAFRLLRSRSTTPVHKRPPRFRRIYATRPPLQHHIHADCHLRDSRIHDVGEHVEIIVGSDKGMTGHVILAASDVVEVQMDDKEERKYYSSNSVRSCASSADKSHVNPSSSVKESRDESGFFRSDAESVPVIEIPENWENHDVPHENLRGTLTRSPSSAFEPVDPPGDKAESIEEMSKDELQLKLNLGEHNAETCDKPPIPIRTQGDFNDAEIRDVLLKDRCARMPEVLLQTKSNMNDHAAKHPQCCQTYTNDSRMKLINAPGSLNVEGNRHSSLTTNSARMVGVVSKPKSAKDEHVVETRYTLQTYTSDRPPKPKITRAVRCISTPKKQFPAFTPEGAVALRTSSVFAASRLSSKASECVRLTNGPQSGLILPNELDHNKTILSRNSFMPGMVVHVIGGMFKNKIGRVVRATEEIVQVNIGGFPQPFFLAPRMLRIYQDS